MQAKDTKKEVSLVKRPSIQLGDAKGEWLSPEPDPDETSEISPGDAEIATDAIDEVELVEDKTVSDDLYTSFVRQATKIARLTEEEERELGIKVIDFGDKQAQKKLVVHNLRLAIKMAHQYRRAWTNLMDLVQEASAGMAVAAQRWDPRKGTRFGTYAAYWIRAYLTKFIMTNARLIHTGTTRAGRKVYFSLPHIRRKLLATGQEPTVELIAKEIGEDPKEVALIVTRLEGREASLSTPIDEAGATTLQDVLEGEQASPEKQTSESEVGLMVKKLFAKFEQTIKSDRDLALWREHLVAEDPISLVELGKRYSVSKQRMGQLATRLKRGFRRLIIDELGPNTTVSWLFRQD